MKEYDVYLMDFDGTLFDTKESLFPVFKYGFEKVGIDITYDDVEFFIHHTLLQSAQSKGLEGDRIKVFFKAVNDAIDMEESVSKITPFSDTVYLISELKRRKKKFGIVSGNISSHIELVLARLGFDPNDFFPIVGSDKYKHGKPCPDPILVAMEMLGDSDKSSITYIGDSVQDAECAEAAGVDGYLINRDGALDGVGKPKIRSFYEIFEY